MMLATAILFSLIAAATVWFAGRRDEARDPRLTLLALGLLAVFPLLFFLPEWQVLPHADAIQEGSLDIGAWLPWIWGAGVLLFSTRLVAALAVLHRWRRDSKRIEAREAGDALVDIRLLDGIAGPVAAGILKPVVFVPPAWLEWPPETREAVLAHEIKHHRRRDPLLRAIGAVACTLHWFNPLVWWMAKRLADQCEYACDEEVLADGMGAERYANVLCDLAASTRSPATALAMAHESGLEARVRRMFSKVPKGSRMALIALVVLTLLTALGLAVIRRADPPAKPAIPVEEIRTRLNADPFPGN
ncbi:M56 family metallopeptidase [Luteolibacter arcticus]|uniref:M56 family metallopeptidase n=1 Tax=Luteolibacter arcticus TaxID=1581411 RepID=A0ABT3GMC6_9BACT|nr:M56 family metallopeptidase [Luteolibacter arcticus]MCW1924683.1 M56 family metallopeptidase [Luteolibacter arcticus]